MTTRVLIVDNNLVDIEAMKEALAEAGFDAVIDLAMDAPEAIGLVQAITSAGGVPDLCLIDLRLSLGSGLDVLNHIRAHGRLRDAPAVIISNVIDPAARESCLAAGATRFDVKPRRFADLVALAREWAALIHSSSPARPAPSRSPT